MNRAPIPGSFTAEQQRFMNDNIFDAAFGTPIELDSDPTTVGGELESVQIGFNPTTSRLFINLSGTTYQIAMTAV